ncbi:MULTISPECIES: DinB family protein [Nocardioides]|uniref:DinB family protein n=1 Tax=Nocardioides vastitatis TaxID=2568655 RepID=A0ABW0ZNY3_9ACTN|nr:DinB family protein [Nocardioides sp.]THI95484.1 DinB family protein [Nocardioides sp.]
MTTEQTPQTEPGAIEPDTKDWTWVLDRPCPECGFTAAAVDTGALAAALRDNADYWTAALADPRAEQRPSPTVWSPTEYACHVRDVHLVFVGRLERMLTEDDPVFANWDQDETALADRYDLQRAAEVAPALAAAAARAAAVYESVAGDAWERPGRRSNGSAFTVATLGRYHLHDVVHHRWDTQWMMEG